MIGYRPATKNPGPTVARPASDVNTSGPPIGLFHGVEARSFVLPAISPEVINPIEGFADRYGPVLFEWPALGADLLFLYHPTRGWLDRQWDAVVVPALTRLRASGHIPT